MRSIRLAQVLGIRIGVHPSWFVILFLSIFYLSRAFADTLGSSDGTAFLTAVVTVGLICASLVAHELGHALVARRNGIAVSGIDLWLMGGMAKMSREPDSPGAEFRIAAAGPLVTLVVTLVCIAAGTLLAGGRALVDAAALTPSAALTPALLTLGWLAAWNAVLLVFNLLPAFPLDGGRLTLAAAWRITGDRRRAQRLAARLGRALAWALAGLGLAGIAMGDLIGVWVLLVALVVGQGARGAAAQSAFSERLDGITVADVMDPEPVAIPAELDAQRAHDDYFLRYRWAWFPVVGEGDRLLGLVRRERVDEAARPGSHTRVGELLERDSAEHSVVADASFESLLTSESLRRFGALMAVDRDGVLRGVVTLGQVRRALRVAVEPLGRA